MRPDCRLGRSPSLVCTVRCHPPLHVVPTACIVRRLVLAVSSVVRVPFLRFGVHPGPLLVPRPDKGDGQGAGVRKQEEIIKKAMIQNPAIVDYYGNLDAAASARGAWPMVKMLETTHPETPYVAQALLQTRIGLPEIIGKVLAYWNEYKVREWRWKRTDRFLRDAWRHDSYDESRIETWIASIEAAKITDVYPIWQKVHTAMCDRRLSHAARLFRYDQAIQPLRLACEDQTLEVFEVGIPPLLPILTRIRHVDRHYGHMLPDPPWFVHGRVPGPAHLYYTPEPGTAENPLLVDGPEPEPGPVV